MKRKIYKMVSLVTCVSIILCGCGTQKNSVDLSGGENKKEESIEEEPIETENITENESEENGEKEVEVIIRMLDINGESIDEFIENYKTENPGTECYVYNDEYYAIKIKESERKEMLKTLEDKDFMEKSLQEYFSNVEGVFVSMDWDDSMENLSFYVNKEEYEKNELLSNISIGLIVYSMSEIYQAYSLVPIEDRKCTYKVIDNETKDIISENNSNQEDNNEISNSDFQTKEYLYENTIGDTIYFVAITNNSNTDVSISGNATAKDSSGNLTGADDMDVSIIGTGETSIGYFYFDGVKGVDSVEYKLSYDSEPYYSPAVKNLSVEKTENEKNVILSVTNNGEKTANFVEAYALFMDENDNVLNYSSDYVDGGDGIMPDDTIAVQLDSYEKYDHVDIYFSGYCEK